MDIGGGRRAWRAKIERPDPHGASRVEPPPLHEPPAPLPSAAAAGPGRRQVGATGVSGGGGPAATRASGEGGLDGDGGGGRVTGVRAAQSPPGPG